MANKSSRNFNTLTFSADSLMAAIYDSEAETTVVRRFEASPNWIIPICCLIDIYNIKTIEFVDKVDNRTIIFFKKKGVKVCQL